MDICLTVNRRHAARVVNRDYFSFRIGLKHPLRSPRRASIQLFAGSGNNLFCKMGIWYTAVAELQPKVNHQPEIQ